MEKENKQDSLATQDQKTELLVKKRDGRVVSFEPGLIKRAIEKAFCAEHKTAEASDLPDSTHLRSRKSTRTLLKRSRR